MKYNKGFFLIEALLSIVIFSVLLLSLFSMISFLQRRSVRSTFESDASILLQDGMEIAHSSLLANWTGYQDSTYFPVFDADRNTWILVQGEETELEARYSRKIELKRVCRNANTGERIEFGSVCTGDLDPNSREITTTVSWTEVEEQKEISASLLVINADNE